MSALTTQSTTPATIPTATQIAADQVGTANAPATGDRIQYVKLDVGAAGASSPITAANPLPMTNANIDVLLSTRLKPADTLAGVTTVAAVTAITNALPAGANKIGTVEIATAPAVAKGTQGANAVPTQDLKDSGRVAISFTAEFSPAAVAETMVTLSISKDGATATTGTSYTITSGKRLRIASKTIAVENTLGTSIQRAYLRTRFNTAGAAVVGSVLQANCIATALGTVKSTGSNFDDYPDGVEFLGDGTKAIGWSVQAPDWVTASATLKVYITIMAFEY